MIFSRTSKKGFTLVELIVSVGLFATVMTLSAGAYLLMISLNRQSQAIASGIDNLSFALETLTRSIRTGTAYGCGTSSATPGNDCATGGSFFVFTDASTGVSRTISYRKSTATSECAPGASGQCIVRSINSGSWLPVTDASVNISNLTFYLSGSVAGAANGKPPYVTIVIQGSTSAGPGKPPKTFSVETSAVMRGTDL